MKSEKELCFEKQEMNHCDSCDRITDSAIRMADALADIKLILGDQRYIKNIVRPIEKDIKMFQWRVLSGDKNHG